MKNFKLGFVGFGNMALAIAKGILSAGLLKCDDVLVFDFLEEQRKKAEALGFCVARDNLQIANECSFVLLAVKPQNIADFDVKFVDNVGISVMAGIKLERLKKLGFQKLARVMPNAPAMVNLGMSAVCRLNLDEEEFCFVKTIFESVGNVVEVSEELLDAVTATSGSGPAYVYYFMRAMMDASEKLGMSQKDAKTLVLSTFEGAVEMVKQSDKSLSEQIDLVCSKGGTTVRAIEVFDESKLDKIVFEGMKRCFERSVELSK